MKKKRELKDSFSHGFAQRLWDFLKLLERMEKKRDTIKTTCGELEGPFDSKAVYGYTVKLGIVERKMR